MAGKQDEQILVTSNVNNDGINNVKQLELSLWKKSNVYDEFLMRIKQLYQQDG